MSDGPLAAYRNRRGTGVLKADPSQQLAAEKLQSLWRALSGYRPVMGHVGWRTRFGLARRVDPTPEGLYIYGDVGRGKSMLMDLFFETSTVERRRRVHFHAFMLEVHQRLHALRQDGGARHNDELLPALARSIADEAWLLCFDEFHVVDVADAMILGRLFTALFELGVVVVATSNWPPDQLYKDGLNRGLFLPFIALLKERLDVLHLAGPTDFRLAKLKGADVYHWPLGRVASAALTRAFESLTGGSRAEQVTLTVQGRPVFVPRAASGVAWFQFEDLCAKPLGAADYLTIATHFHTVLVDGVPMLTPERRNEAKRFMTLVDALYEHKVNLVVAAEATAERLYPEGSHAFEFQRTVSRLMEMQAEDYLAADHLP